MQPYHRTCYVYSCTQDRVTMTFCKTMKVLDETDNEGKCCFLIFYRSMLYETLKSKIKANYKFLPFQIHTRTPYALYVKACLEVTSLLQNNEGFYIYK